MSVENVKGIPLVMSARLGMTSASALIRSISRLPPVKSGLANSASKEDAHVFPASGPPTVTPTSRVAPDATETPSPASE